MIQLFSHDGGVPGDAGFRLTGVAKEGDGLCRVHLRRFEPWHRYNNPRVWSEEWDVRVYTKTDASFTLETELTVADLDALVERYTFPGGASELGSLRPNGDPVFDRTLAWAQQVTGADAAEVKTDIFPVHLDVRYTPSSAKSTTIAPIPAGRPTPPFHDVKPLAPVAAQPVKKDAVTRPVPAAPALPKTPAAARPRSPREDKPTPRVVDALPRSDRTMALGTVSPDEAPSAKADALSVPVVSSPSAAPAKAPALPPRQPVSSKLTQRLHSIREELEAERSGRGKETGDDHDA